MREINKPWVSFCMSTFNRPEFLKAQITSLLQQTLHDFEIIISDNDPNGGAKVIVDFFNDDRIKYSCNGKNLGIIHSYNGSMNRATGEYIVIVTDDTVRVNIGQRDYVISDDGVKINKHNKKPKFDTSCSRWSIAP